MLPPVCFITDCCLPALQASVIERAVKLEVAGKLWYVAAHDVRSAARLISAGVLDEALDVAGALPAEFDGVVSALPPASHPPARLRLRRLGRCAMRLGMHPACSCHRPPHYRATVG